jgi:hypothetical protein
VGTVLPSVGNTQVVEVVVGVSGAFAAGVDTGVEAGVSGAGTEVGLEGAETETVTVGAEKEGRDESAT